MFLTHGKRLGNTFENIDILDPTICERGIMISLDCYVFLNNEPCRKIHHGEASSQGLKQRVRRLVAIEGLFRGNVLVENFDEVEDEGKGMDADGEYKDDEDIGYRRRLQKTCIKLALYSLD
ncbi:hypothetical protein HPP92_014863 [Vanilla planifolia]|uniref:Uncharacterized protein n=1 Tax=Vanilla planifolia TaxID=51239 RepID=A0A835UV91_VANPL|nr:hypothetical protein HPP92_014863 [Vanilla planifolia]